MINKILLLICASVLITTSALAEPLQKINETKLYVGSNSTEATMTFTGLVSIESGTKPNITTMRRLIENQIDHAIGPMSVAKYKAVPKGDQVISNIKISSKNENLYSVSYEYTGTIVVENGPKTSYEVVMPIDPAKIYSAAMVGSYNPCTDDHYQTEGDFWYFWNPENPGCKLILGEDYLIIKAKITRFKNTTISYPEYQNLPDENGITTIHVLFGLDDPTKDRNPITSSDINADNYRQFRNYLVKQGYIAKRWSTIEIKKIAQTTNGKAPFVETLEKENISYRFFFGPTGIDEDSLAFHWFYKDAIENASVLLYGGHSGLGGHLDLAMIEESLGVSIKFNKKRYQIFFFDSCTSYKYYNQQYFERKVSTKDPNGTKKLDIFTNGLGTYFHTMPNSNKALAIALDKALNYAKDATYVSYQSLAKQIDSDNLFGIIGDEDNEKPE